MVEPIFTILSRRPWSTPTFAGEVVVAEADADLPIGYLDGLGIFEGQLVADCALQSSRRVELCLVEEAEQRR